MKVLHISTSDKGGAGIAASRLHQKLLSRGIQSSFLTLHNLGKDNIPSHYIINRKKDLIGKIKKKFKRFNLFLSEEEKASVFLRNKPSGYEHFSFPFSEIELQEHPLYKEHDLIHLHWVSDGLLDYEKFFKGNTKKIVWSLHDMNPFTGGCHHSDDCLGYKETCMPCPQLYGAKDENFSGNILEIKKSALSNIAGNQMIITTPSKWMQFRSSSSVLFSRFNHWVIPNVFDENIYFPYDKKKIRRELGIPEGKMVLLFVSHNIENIRKGIQYLIEALNKIQKDNILVCTLGSSYQKISDVEVMSLGFIEDDAAVAKVYSASDLFVLPSLAENFPNSIAEAMLCGTPSLAFDVGGIPEQIDENSGVIVPLKDTQKLADIISMVSKGELSFNRENVRKTALKKFSSDQSVSDYIKLYKSLLD